MLGFSCRSCSLLVGTIPGFPEASKSRFKCPQDHKVLAAQIEPISKSGQRLTDLVLVHASCLQRKKSGEVKSFLRLLIVSAV